MVGDKKGASTVPKKLRMRHPKEMQVFVFRRDRWLCHWCGRPVIFVPAMRYLQQELSNSGYGSLAYWTPACNRYGSPLLDELAAVVDHKQAFSKGGSDDVANFVTACNKCNTRKNDYHASKLPPIKPIRSKYGPPDKWDGFSSLFLHLAKRHKLTQSEKEWQKALQQKET